MILINHDEAAIGNEGDKGLSFWNIKNEKKIKTFENMKIIGHMGNMYFDEKTKYLIAISKSKAIIINTIIYEVIGIIELISDDIFNGIYVIKGSKDGEILLSSRDEDFITSINCIEGNIEIEIEKIVCCEKYKYHTFIFFDKKIMSIHI